MKRSTVELIAAFVLLSIILWSAGASALPSRRAVERLLAGYEPRATPAEFQRLGDGVDRILVEIALDPATSRIRRNRALYALAVVPSGEGRSVLRRVLRDLAGATSGMDLLDLIACIRSLAVFGESSSPWTQDFLAHENLDVRQATAESLARAHAASALPALRARLRVEREPEVVRSVERAIAALSAP